MSNHNYNNYYKKFENNKNKVTEPELTTSQNIIDTAENVSIVPEVAPEITSGIPDVPGVAKVAEVTVLEPEAPAESETKNGVVCNCAKLNVREKPVAGSRVVSIIDANTELTVTTDESFGIFYKICTASGVEGYCMKDYVRLV